MKKITLIIALAIITVSCNTKKEVVTNNEQVEAQVSSMALSETVWNLQELNGQVISLDKNFPKQPNLIFTRKNDISGNLGCNNFSSNYQLTDNTITIKQIASTQMACPNLAIEQKFIEVLEQTKHVEIEKDILLLKNKDQEIIAKLKAEQAL